MDWPYQIVDGGWYVNRRLRAADITRLVPAIDLDAVRRFAAERNVTPVAVARYWTDAARYRQLQESLRPIREMGYRGSQDRLHGSRRSGHGQLVRDDHALRRRTPSHGGFPRRLQADRYESHLAEPDYPRRGDGQRIQQVERTGTAEHRVTLPFTRFLAGPGRFHAGQFRQPHGGGVPADSRLRTQVQGTRAEELALFVVYDSPFVVVADYPG